MTQFKFGKKSLSRLQTCHQLLQELCYLALARSPIDFSILEGHRSIERQYELYLQELTKIDGVTLS